MKGSLPGQRQVRVPGLRTRGITRYAGEAAELPLRVEREAELGLRRIRPGPAGASATVPSDLEGVDVRPTGVGLNPLDQAPELDGAETATKEEALALHHLPDISPRGVADRAALVVNLQGPPPARAGR